MFLQIDAQNRIGERAALRAMFEARKRVFVDLLKWDIPVLDGRFEIDQFDDGHAIYIVLADRENQHLASARLLPTTRPGILSSLCPPDVAGLLPSGEGIYEVTRFCLSPDLPARARRICRDALVTELARFALDRGIATYTGLAEKSWLRQILAFGWDCSQLGGFWPENGSMLGALRIDIADDTLVRLADAGISGGAHDVFPLTRAA